MNVKIQPQSGLGDLLFALPLIEKLVSNEARVIVVTNHRHVLAPYAGAVDVVPVEMQNRLPVIQPDAHHLRYDRYSHHYFKTYFNAFVSTERAAGWVNAVRERFLNYARTVQSWDTRLVPAPKHYFVFAPARAAQRHKHLKDPFECAPTEETERRALSYSLGTAGITAGQGELYPGGYRARLQTAFDLTDNLDFFQLAALVANAERVISQVSAITALAGLLGVKTDFLSGRHETEAQHAKHVDGVAWPGQEIVKRAQMELTFKA